MGRLGKAARLLVSDPAALARVALGKLAVRFPRRHGTVLGAVGDVRFEFPLDLDPAVRLMIHGAYEVDTVRAFRRLLAPGDTFVDVGANIGYLTAVGASRVGPAGQVHAFEPAPEHAARVRRLVELNPGRRIVVNECALGDAPGTAMLDLTAEANIGWNTLVPGFMSPETRRAQVAVPVARLDAYLLERRATLGRVTLIKIDVEGFEFAVLRGLAGWWTATGERPAILCEIGSGAYRLLGTDLATFDAFMRDAGYEAWDLATLRRRVSVSAVSGNTTVVFRPAPR